MLWASTCARTQTAATAAAIAQFQPLLDNCAAEPLPPAVAPPAGTDADHYTECLAALINADAQRRCCTNADLINANCCGGSDGGSIADCQAGPPGSCRWSNRLQLHSMWRTRCNKPITSSDACSVQPVLRGRVRAILLALRSRHVRCRHPVAETLALSAPQNQPPCSRRSSLPAEPCSRLMLAAMAAAVVEAGAQEGVVAPLEEFNAKCAAAAGRAVGTTDSCRGRSCGDCTGRCGWCSAPRGGGVCAATCITTPGECESVAEWARTTPDPCNQAASCA